MDKLLSSKNLLFHPKLSTGKEKISFALQILLILVLLYPVLMSPKSANASVTEAFVRFDRHSTGAAISGTACEKTGTSGNETGVVLVFPSGWTVSSTASNWTVSTSNLPVDPNDGVTAATAWPGINTATSVNGLSVVFPSTDLSTATFYCFNFAGASSTIGSAGNDQTGQLKTEGGSPYVDSTNWATSVVTSNADQITVTASVSATMTFSLSANNVSLGTLSTSSVTSDAGITQHVSTNARNGWVSWVESANGALHSTVASANLSAGSFTLGSGNIVDLSSNSGYVLDADSGSGSPTIATEYNGNTANKGGKLDTHFEQTASATTPANDNTVTLIVRAKAGATTPAASDYTDTLTIAAAGSF